MMTGAARRAALLLLLAAAALVPAAGGLAAQDTIPARPPAPRPAPPPADTIPRDSAQVAIPGEAVRGDTIPNAAQDTTPPDSTIAAPSFPEHPLPPAFGFSDGAWLFGPQELQYFHGLSLADLLDRIPGLVVTKSGGFGRPMGVSPYAGGGGRFRVFVDGYEVRPMTSATADLQRIPVANLQSVRIQRGLDEVRVDVTSLRLADIRPFAQIEGADGDLDTRFLRGIFTRPIGRRMVGEIALDLDRTDGTRRREEFSIVHTIARLSYAFTPTVGLQAEYRVGRLDSESQLVNDRESLDRSEAILRGRGNWGRLWLEAMVGRSTQEPAGTDTLTLATRSTQASARATVDLTIGRLTGGVRLHRGDDETWAPDQTEAWGRLDFTPGRALAASGEVRSLTVGGTTGFELQGSLRAGPFGGFSLFGQIAAGTRGIRTLRDTVLVVKNIGGIGGLPGLEEDSLDVQVFRMLESRANGLRAGAELARGSARLGAAFVAHDVDRIAPYGFWFDRGIEPPEGERITGVEAYAFLPLFWHLRLTGEYAYFLDTPDRWFLPSQLGRAALEFHGVFKQGNFEPTLRFEAVGRDEAVAPDRTTGELALTPAYVVFNSFVQLRIIDIRIFWRFENVFDLQTASDVPGTLLPSGRALYGVRWYFRN